MPQPQSLLMLLRQALVLTRATPGRRGHILRLQDCDEILVAGDLHGHVENFRKLLSSADLPNHPRRHLVLQEIIHGPFRYAQGADKSHQLVDLYAALKCQFPKRVHLLPGNHELAQWTGRKISKGGEDLNSCFQTGVELIYGRELGLRIYEAYLDLFRASPLAIYCPNRILICHSLPQSKCLGSFNPQILEMEEFQEVDTSLGGAVHNLLWGRDSEESTVLRFLEVMDADLLVSGHIACEKGYDVPNNRQLILDSADSPAGYALFPTNYPMSHQELVSHVQIIGEPADNG